MNRTDVLLAMRDAYAENLTRLTRLLEAPACLQVPIGGGSVWSVREAAVHLAVVSNLYTELAAGLPSPAEQLGREYIAEKNEQLIADIAETDPEKVITLLRESASRYLNRTQGWPADHAVTWHCGIQMDLADLTAVLAAETELHGFDVAQALGAPWPIAAERALVMLGAYAPLLGACVNTTAAAGHTAAYGLTVRGGPSLTVRFTDGTFALEPYGDDVDCEISADPVAFLLTFTGRLSRWPAIALGLISADGPRPVLALRFPDLFTYP